MLDHLEGLDKSITVEQVKQNQHDQWQKKFENNPLGTLFPTAKKSNDKQ